MRRLGKTVRRFLQPIASAGELDEHGAVYQPIEDRRRQCRIAQIALPVADDPVRGDERAAAM